MTELVTGIIGIAGVLFGLFADRLLQRHGKVRCEMEPIEINAQTGEEGGSGGTVRRLPVPADYLPDRDLEPYTGWGDALVRCSIKAKLFNEKEVRTGLRDVVLAFDGNPPLEKTMQDRGTWRSTAHSTHMDDLEIVNLPSREWLALDLEVVIEPKEAQMLATCNRAWLRGYFPDGKRFSQQVPFAD